ncbi:MAG: hypothetical protein CVU61_14125 [Deltaproteobacteria bacterium HGW-Deltaproteobacteria-19]|jgi:hypothetical protein|nr:MAG: hypothetical protein CVU61_14125 [Deltaproteobacteria bacterium HGW-Deltaproteobacteria-19]
MKKSVYALCLGILFLLFTNVASSQAAETILRSYSLSDYGILQFQVPADWSDEVSQPRDRPEPTISFKPKRGKPFNVMVTPHWPPGKGMSPPGDAALRGRVQKRAEEIKSGAVEDRINIRKLEGTSATGYYFSATDRAPEEGGYRYMTQGIARAGNVLMHFTILANDDREAAVSAGLAMVGSAACKESEGRKDAGASRQAVQIGKRDGQYVLTAPPGRIVLSFPQNGLMPDKSAGGGGGTDNPGYFYFDGGDSGIILSGWFEPAGAFEDREKYFATIRNKLSNLGPVLVENITTRKIGFWDVMTYSMFPKAKPEWVQFNLRASCVREDTWIDLHISSSISRDKLIAFLKSVGIETKQQ